MCYVIGTSLFRLSYILQFALIYFVSTRWDHGGRNSYRMGAEGKFDLKVVSGSGNENPRTGRKSHSTPSLPEATATDQPVCLNSLKWNICSP